MTRTLAFGDDQSPGADECWGWIASHLWEGWDLQVITTDPPADLHPVPPEEAGLHPWEPDRPRDASGLGFGSVEYLRAEIDPRVALIAREWGLVAIGPRGAGVLKSLRLGSTADWLLRQPTSPLLIAHRGEAVRRALVCVDGSQHARRAVETLASLPFVGRSSVTVISVRDGRVDAESALSATRDLLGDSGAELATVVRDGKPTKAIIDEIEAIRPDLVVMGARGHAGLKRLVLGSTTSAVASSTGVSLLVAHARET